MARIAVALFDSFEDAAEAVRRLEGIGIPSNEISIVANHGEHRHIVPSGTAEDAAGGAGTGTVIGTALGAGAGLLAGLGLVVIPGLGPMVAAGWLAAMAAGAGAGAATGGLIGVLAGAGIGDEDARVYVESVRQGGALVTARVDESQFAAAEAILAECKAVDPAKRTAQGEATRADPVSQNPLIASDRVEGTAVYDPNGKHIGSIERMMIDKVSGQVAYVVLSFGGFLGMGQDTETIPWNALEYDMALGGYRMNITEDQVRGRAITQGHEL